MLSSETSGPLQKLTAKSLLFQAGI